MKLTLLIALGFSQLFQQGVSFKNDIMERDSDCIGFLWDVEQFACEHRGLEDFINLDVKACALECENSSEKLMLPKDIHCQERGLNCEKNREGLKKWHEERKKALQKIFKRFCKIIKMTVKK
uniref:Putative ixodes 10 kDa peptide protein n=1 Tax=Ixodes ricinus TaxID=34613 RepID=A0A0K8RDC5_IXORI